MASLGLNILVLLALVAYCSGLTVGPFQNVIPGIWDAWNRSDPAHVNQGGFAMQVGVDKVWLISRRLYRKNLKDPGIVSTLNISSKTWTHNPYAHLDEDQSDDKSFSLNGHLFMLTYSTNLSKIGFHKLFFWNDYNHGWIETPFDINPASTTLSTNEIVRLSLTVPSQAGKSAYLVASAHSYTIGSEIAFSKLDVDFRGNVPIKATLKPLARKEIRVPTGVYFTAVKDNILYAFIENIYSEGFSSITDFAYALDLNTNHLGNVTLTGDFPRMEYDGDRMFQTKDTVFIAGGSQHSGIGQVSHVRDIWSLSLTNFQWTAINTTTPESGDDSVAYDQSKGRLYVAGLEEGVKVAQLTI